MNDTTTTPTSDAPAGDTSGAIQTGDFSPEQLRQMATWEVERGRLTQAEADAMLASDGVVAPEVKPEAGLSPDAAEIDAGFPPARPQDFEFPLYNAPGEGLTPDQMKFDATARGWMADARLPREIGNSIAKEIDREASAHANMSSIDRELYRKQTEIMLDRLWGADAPNKIAAARQLVRELNERRPGLLALLNATGAGNNPRVIAALALHAERLALRRAK